MTVFLLFFFERDEILLLSYEKETKRLLFLVAWDGAWRVIGVRRGHAFDSGEGAGGWVRRQPGVPALRQPHRSPGGDWTGRVHRGRRRRHRLRCAGNFRVKDERDSVIMTPG